MQTFINIKIADVLKFLFSLLKQKRVVLEWIEAKRVWIGKVSSRRLI